MPQKTCAAIFVLVWFATTPGQAQTVQFEDLHGAMIEADLVYSRTFRREGQLRSNELRSQFKLVPGPGGTIDQTVISTAVRPNGRDNSQTSKVTFTLNKPYQGRNGPVVWKFENGTLTRLQSLLSGARRISIVVKRDGGKLTCSIDGAFAREDGVGEIETRSRAKPGATVQWLDIKQKSTNCQVSKL